VSTDRNLLFGILALQMDFISRDQLVQPASGTELATQAGAALGTPAYMSPIRHREAPHGETNYHPQGLTL
jgi:hypothetical protein